MVGQDAVRRVQRILEISAVRTGPSPRSDRFKNTGEHVGVVVAVFALQDTDNALKSHPGINVLCGQRHQRAVVSTVELHEHQVPNFDDLRIIRIHQVATTAIGSAIEVNFGARTTRSGRAHFPEVVFLVEPRDAIRRNKATPQFRSLFISRQAVGLITGKHRDVQSFGRQAPDLSQQFPRPFDGLGFEVVAERPVAQHLEEGVVVGVPSNIFQVVVLAASADAFLGVDGTDKVTVTAPEENILELVHPGIGKQQGGVVMRDHRARIDHGVLVALSKEIKKLLTNFGRGRGHGWTPGGSIVRIPWQFPACGTPRTRLTCVVSHQKGSALCELQLLAATGK